MIFSKIVGKSPIKSNCLLGIGNHFLMLLSYNEIIYGMYVSFSFIYTSYRSPAIIISEQ